MQSYKLYNYISHCVIFIFCKCDNGIIKQTLQVAIRDYLHAAAMFA